MEHNFTVITWPDVQSLFEMDGFHENSLLINDGMLFDEFGSSAYMVRVNWLETMCECGVSKLY